MKKIFLVGIIAVILGACATQEKLNDETVAAEVPSIESLETDLSMLIRDTDFNNWFNSQGEKSKYLDINYYQRENMRYITKRNITQFKTYDIMKIENIQFQHKLYSYFKYLEKYKKYMIRRENPNP